MTDNGNRSENSEESPFDFQKFEELLKDICTLDPKIEKVLHSFKGDNFQPNVDCEFLLIKSKEKIVREEDFIKVLLGAIVRYTLKYIKTHPSSKNPTPKEVEDFQLLNMVDLVHEAKGLFIQKLSEEKPTTSEFGELFLFMLLENKGIVQLLNKMNLKTNGDMPIHGLDAIHIGVRGDALTFYYGYSKVYDDHTDAVRSSLKEIDVFSKNQKRQDREFDLVSDYIDKEKFRDFSDKIINIISPYASDKSFVSEAHAVFAGYHWSLLDDPTTAEGTKLDEYLKDEYLKKTKQMEKNIKSHIKDFPDSRNYSFLFWTLPLSDLKLFRLKFVDRVKSL